MFYLDSILGPDAPKIGIIDVGAMKIPGEVPNYQPLCRPGRFHLVGFEAVKEECDKLNQTAQPGERYVNCFVGDGSTRTFTQTNYSMTSSLYPPNTALLKLFNNLEELTRPVRTMEVQTTRLDDVPELSDPAAPIDFIKIDVQGAEKDVFSGASKLLSTALVIQAEVEFVPMYAGQPLYGDVDAMLRKNGFLLHSFLFLAGRAFKPLINNDVNQAFRQHLWSDAIFVRDFSKLEALTPEQLLKLATILHDVYTSADLVQLCLAHYDRRRGTRYWAKYMSTLIPGMALPLPPV